MYSSRGNNAYGQQSKPQLYSGQSAFGQNDPYGSSHYGGHPSAGARYGGQYSSLYGSTAHNSVLQTDIYDRLDSASALRQELLQSASIDGSPRQADYLAARSATVRSGQDLLSYGGRYDTDLHALSMISSREHPPSILGAAPRREVEDLMYGVSLPPGRAYVSGRSLRGTSLESDYPGGILARADYSRLGDREDDVAYAREIERREEDRRWEILRERERERDRKRLRERERERMLERRERERERERESRRDRTPLRISRDRGRSTSAKPGKSSRRETPRRHSPGKENRREYVCKVYSSNLVDPERDYLSMDKRYPRLYVSAECSKVVVNWSRETLNIPFNTPVSFEHDFVQEETPTEHESSSTKTLTNDHAKLESGTTRWNAKLLLMSGLSHNALEELSSERKYEDRIPHLCNMLRFAFIKDGHSCMAIGGSWDPVDGNDPLVDKSVLVQTVLRHTKELTGLDLKNCRKWNSFLEIHYDRIGKDGLFSHKEITVLYIPDLSDCLPSIDAWIDQWRTHKKAVAERERLHSLKKEKSREKTDKELEKKKDLGKGEKTEKKKEAESTSKVIGKEKVVTKVNAKEAGKDGDKTVNEKKDGDKTVTEKKDGDKTVNEKKDRDKTVTEKKDEGETVDEGNISGKMNQTPDSGKKKVVSENDDTNADIIKDAESSGTPVRKDNEAKQPECSDVTTKNEDVVGASDNKPIVKKKINKKVTKKKVASKGVNNKDKVVNENEAGSTIGEQTGSEVKLENNESISEAVPQSGGGSKETGDRSENIQVKEEKKVKVEGVSDKNEKLKDGKRTKDKDVKTESKGKEVKDKKKAEEPPRHPGLILQTKENKNSKPRSLSLSLDSLLDYTDKDIEESTFELSVFAETFYEMLQFQMGSRILTFLQKLRIKFVAKMNQKKRQREEASEKKEKEKITSSKTSSPKRQKTDDVTVESRPVKTEALHESGPLDEITVKDENMVINDNVDNMKAEDKSVKDEDIEEEEEEEEEPEEDPEEDLEEDENMADVVNEEKAEVDKVDMDAKSEKMDEKVKDGQEEDAKTTVNLEKKEDQKVDTKKKETTVAIDKKLLQAFRFFDRNRLGYIRVEDLRLILHALGNCMSHRDVKELVQSALLESNSSRGDRVLYNKLVKMTDI